MIFIIPNLLIITNCNSNTQLEYFLLILFQFMQTFNIILVYFRALSIKLITNYNFLLVKSPF